MYVDFHEKPTTLSASPSKLASTARFLEVVYMPKPSFGSCIPRRAWILCRQTSRWQAFTAFSSVEQSISFDGHLAYYRWTYMPFKLTCIFFRWLRLHLWVICMLYHLVWISFRMLSVFCRRTCIFYPNGLLLTCILFRIIYYILTWMHSFLLAFVFLWQACSPFIHSLQRKMYLTKINVSFLFSDTYILFL